MITSIKSEQDNNLTPPKSKSGKFKKRGGKSLITPIKTEQDNNLTPPKSKSGKFKKRGGKSLITSIKSGQGNNSGKGVGDTGEAAKVVCVCAPPLPEEKSIAVTPTASPTSSGMATTTLNIEVGISLPSITPTAKIIAVNKSPGSKGRVLSAEGDEAIEDRVEGVANSTTDNVERSDTTSRLNTDREHDHASADNDKDTAHILSPVPNANAAPSKKTNEMNVKLTAAYLGEEDSCNDAATNNAGPCKLLPSKHHPFVEGSGSHSTDTASYSNFHNEFIRDQASRAAQLYQGKSNSFRASFIAKSNENVRVAIPVKMVFRTVSDKNKDWCN